MSPRLNELEIFIAVAESKSFSQAAERLDIAASVVSRSIKKLESDLNTTLFNRTTRSVSLTDEGLWLLEKSRQIMENLSSIVDHFHNDQQSAQGLLRVDAATPFALHAIAPLLKSFSEQYPKIDVVLESNESITNLIERRVDVAIRIGELSDSSLKAKLIGKTRRGLYAAPSYLEKFGTPSNAENLIEHKCLGFSRYEKLNIWPIIDKSGQHLIIKPSLRSTSGETLKQMALFGNGIVCLSSFTVKKELEAGELIPILPDEIKPEAIPIYAVYYSEKALSPRIRAFIDYVVENIEI